MKKSISFIASAIIIMALAAITQKANAQWNLTGNATVAPNNILGTTNTTSLDIRTNNTSRLFIKGGNGFIGIGTTTPQFIFDAVNTGSAVMSFKSTTGNSNILIERGVSSATAIVSYRTAGAGFWQTGNLNDDNFTISNVGVGPSLTILRSNNNVGIGTALPANTLDVKGITGTTGNFVNTATGADNFGVYGNCSNSPFFGYGVKGLGGYKGVEGEASIAGTGIRIGVYGTGSNGASNNYGVQGTASGGAIATGIYGTASGATTNWAGYFAGGNVYVQNNAGIGTIAPVLAKLQVQGAVGNTVGMFSNSANSKGVSLVSDSPGLYFNCYYNGGTRAMASTGYPSTINTDQNNGSLTFSTTNVANTAAGGAVIPFEQMRVTGDGKVGIGTANPLYTLDVVSNLNTTGSFVNTNSSGVGVYGSSNVNSANGEGVLGVGGLRGVHGQADISGTGD